MPEINRRAVLANACASLMGAAFAGTATAMAQPRLERRPLEGRYTSAYGPIRGEPFPVPAAPLGRINPAYLRARVAVRTGQAPGTLVIDPRSRYLYLIGEGGYALRYGVGVGRQGFAWSGTATINSKQEWPDWYPPKEMIQRQPELRPRLVELQSGLGVPGGPHRHERLVRLHPHDQSGRHRPLRPHSDRHPGRGAGLSGREVPAGSGSSRSWRRPAHQIAEI
jgi:lipoprotein-anchoring transpeptidase ErfK/SrfK